MLFASPRKENFVVSVTSHSLRSADAQVRDFLLHSMSDVSSNSQGRWLQQTCTLFIQSGVQLLAEFTRQAAAWANSSLIRTNFSQPNQSVSQHLEPAGNSRGEKSHHAAVCHRGPHCTKAAAAAAPSLQVKVASPQRIIVRLLKSLQKQSSVDIRTLTTPLTQFSLYMSGVSHSNTQMG